MNYQMQNSVTDKPLSYWDYISLQSLLSLQNPRTDFPDEKIFIIHHQVTELYFKLIILEMEQICGNQVPSASEFVNRMKRINSYFIQINQSFDLLHSGMDREQFMQFRTALSPASGFQSFQFRLIQIYATDLSSLLVTPCEHQSLPTDEQIVEGVKKLYWRAFAVNEQHPENTTLQAFDKQYLDLLIDAAVEYKERNIRRVYQNFFADSGNRDVDAVMREFDSLANVHLPMSHLKMVHHYLTPKTKSTGGTEWQKYLHPKARRIMFFPELWSEMEKTNWGG